MSDQSGGEMKPLNSLIPMRVVRSRKIRRAVAKVSPEELKLGRKLTNMAQLLYAMLLDRDDPDAPVTFSKDDIEQLDPREVIVKIEGNDVTVRLRGPGASNPA